MLLDILPEIFGNLAMDDLLRCRRVCKAWRYVIEKRFLRELCLFVGSLYAPDVWFIENELIDPRSVLEVKNLNLLAHPNFIQTFQNLKRLMIKKSPFIYIAGEKTNLDALASYHQLEHLELYIENKWEGFESKSLKKFYFSSYPLTASQLPNLETMAFNSWRGWDSNKIGPVDRLRGNLKVVIGRFYQNWMLELRELERLYALYLDEDTAKPRVFVARFEKLLLLDIYHVCLERHFVEILEEVASLRAGGRNVKFYHEGCEVSNEAFPHDQREVIRVEYIRNFSTDLRKLVSFAADHPNLVRPFFTFEKFFDYKADSPITSLKPPSFKFLQSFRNIKLISIKDIGYQEIRNLLINFRQLLSLWVRFEEKTDELDDQFFDDLPHILEHLIVLEVFHQKAFERLDFLVRFKRLLKFYGRYEENPNNQQIAELIEKRVRNKIYPPAVILQSLWILNLGELGCKNYLK